ncbi:MAG: hypothetical protein ACJAQ6_001261 [Arenicella sp.]|jgi:hypothetical protein
MIRILLLILLIVISAKANASGNSISKIYNPYVQQLEKEIEYEVVLQDDDRTRFADQQQHRLAYGRSISDRWLLEAGIIASDLVGQNLELSGYELEAKYQISEQGEFSNDWGILFEVERESDNDLWEFATTLIVLHQWKKWVGTANLTLAYETGPSIVDEVESELAAQLKYRSSASFEPGIEFFKSQSTNAAGPSISGRIRLAGGRKLFWTTAALFSFDKSKPDSAIRLNIEYEFQ